MILTAKWRWQKEKRISEIEEKSIEIIQSEEQKEKIKIKDYIKLRQ